jgi:RNA polymerase sigma factor (sigma-70 family)
VSKYNYFEIVGREHRPLSKNEEVKTCDQLEKLQYKLRDSFFNATGGIDLIRTEISKKTSLASVTNDFDIKKKGNNRSIAENITRYLTKNNLSKKEGKKILHELNLKESWLMQDIFPKLSQEDQQKITKVRKDLSVPEQRLVSSALKTAVKLAFEHKGSLTIDEAIQTANLGLMEAVKRYSRKKNSRFITYAYIRMRYFLKMQTMNNKSSIMSVPHHAKVSAGYGSWVPLDKKDLDKLPSEEDVEDDVYETAANSSLLREMRDLLSDREFEVIHAKYLGHNSMLSINKLQEKISFMATPAELRKLEVSGLEKLRGSSLLQELMQSMKDE